ncbi:MAG: DUF5916 domain-containing protein [Pseudomonadales bacterium]
MPIRQFFSVLVVIGAWSLGAQAEVGEQALKGMLGAIPMHRFDIQTTTHSDADIKVDGRVDEAIWATVPYYDNMIVSVPGTGEPAEYKTEMRIFATERGLYVSAVMIQPLDSLTKRLTPRDQFIDRDTFGITVDPSGQGLFAYWFIVALGDAVMDGKVLPERRYSNDWDGPWLGKSAVTDEGWSVEFYLPWSMLNLPAAEATRTIGFAASRQVSSRNQRYQWPGHSYASPQFVTALNDMRVSDVSPRRQWSVIPYASMTENFAADDRETRAGLDLNWQLSSRLGLTLSVEPDFGAVEADDVVLNLTALETFFPEKRLFFLEGNELYETTPRANLGNGLRETTNENFATTSRRVFLKDHLAAPISLINTRRIGGTANQVAVPAGIQLERGERDQPTDLLGAVKLSGSAGGLRYGMLSAFEDDVSWRARDAAGEMLNVGADGRSFSAFRLLYEKSDADRFGLGYLGTWVDGPSFDANVHGIDLHYGKGSGLWNVDVQLMRSDKREVSGNGAIVDVRYAPTSTYQHKFELEYFDDQIDINDMGFLRRNNYRGTQYIFSYAFPKPSSWYRATRGTVVLRHHQNLEGETVDSGVFWRNTLEVKGRNTIRTGVGWLAPRTEDRNSRGNGRYDAKARPWWQVLWSTNASKLLTYSFGVGGIGEDLGGYTSNLSAGVTARMSDSLYFDLDLAFKRRDDWIVYRGGRQFGAFDAYDVQPTFDLNWFIRANHQIKFRLQWAGVKAYEDGYYQTPILSGALQELDRLDARDNFTVSLLTAQLRYRWEIAPLTDLYVVYNRGNQLPGTHEDEFTSLFTDSFVDPVVNSLIVKLRYRFGS